MGSTQIEPGSIVILPASPRVADGDTWYVTTAMGLPKGSAPSCSEGEIAWMRTEVPSTTAAPATSDGAPEAVNKATPSTASNAPPPPATAPQPVAIGFGSVSEMVSWAVPPGGEAAFSTLSESGVAASTGNAARDPHGAIALSCAFATGRGLKTGWLSDCAGPAGGAAAAVCAFTRNRCVDELARILPDPSFASTRHKSGLPGTKRAATPSGSANDQPAAPAFHTPGRSPPQNSLGYE